MIAATGSTAAWAQFTPGRIVVSQYGDGITSGTVPITLREFTTSGSATGWQVALPTVGSGANRPIVGSISSTGIGLLKQSADSRFLSIIGSGTAASTLTIARIDNSGAVDSTTGFSVASGGGPTPRAAITSTGIDFWWSASTGNNDTAGIRYLTLGGTTTGVALAQGTGASSTTPDGPNQVPLNARSIGIFGGQLYGSSNVAVGGGASAYSFRGVYNVGTGLPTVANQLGSIIVGGGTSNSGRIDGAWDFFIADSSTIYVADDDTTAPATGGLQKWLFSSGSWSKVWTAVPDGATGMRGLTGVVTGSSVQLFGITAMATGTAANDLVALSDTLGGTLAPSFTTLATASTNYVFRGVALAPVPEPTTLTLSLTGGAAVAAVVRFRRRRAGA
ncbi:MAG: hypothetical protein ACKO6E_11930 [Planctomycetota bacterium]